MNLLNIMKSKAIYHCVSVSKLSFDMCFEAIEAVLREFEKNFLLVFRKSFKLTYWLETILHTLIHVSNDIMILPRKLKEERGRTVRNALLKKVLR